MSKDLEQKKTRAADWFRSLRDQICAEFEAIETELVGRNDDLPAGTFTRKGWQRPDEEEDTGGGGTMSIMRGRVFEKVGVNISEVYGTFSKDFRKEIPGAGDDGRFWASGISLVAHMHSPLVPAVHMNTRFIVTSGDAWFGGGADLNPMFTDDQDTQDFHNRLKQACDAHNPEYYEKYKAWCDEYFMIKHWNEPRGVGGIFYDRLNSGDWKDDFAFTQDVGKAFLDIYPQLVRRHMARNWTEEEREHQLFRRGRYAEFNLVYDRGTRFGLMTGGNPEAVLMSLPPEAKWP